MRFYHLWDYDWNSFLFVSKSVAVELLKALNVNDVYAADGMLVYSCNCNQVLGGSYHRYCINDRGNVEKVGGFIVFDVMDRYPCISDYDREIKDYPVY